MEADGTTDFTAIFKYNLCVCLIVIYHNIKKT